MAAMWRREVTAWTLDNLVVHLRQPPLEQLIPLVLDESPVRLVLATIRDPGPVAVVLEALMDRRDPVDAQLLDEVADEIVAAWFGRKRWVVQRLWREALGMWHELDGELCAAGVDLFTLTPDRATNTIYAVLRRPRTHEASELDRWLRELNAMPDRVLDTIVGQETAAADWAALSALTGMGDMPGGPGAEGVDSELIIT